MSNRIRLVVAFAALVGGGASAVACSSAPPSAPPAGQSASDLQMCFGNLCVDADVPGFDDAAIPAYPGFDAGVAPPSFGFDAGIAPPSFAFDAAMPTYCDWTNPKYGQEYDTAALGAQVKPCWLGCAATECCYANLSCVAQ